MPGGNKQVGGVSSGPGVPSAGGGISPFGMPGQQGQMPPMGTGLPQQPMRGQRGMGSNQSQMMRQMMMRQMMMRGRGR